jgi:hypothetical protein
MLSFLLAGTHIDSLEVYLKTATQNERVEILNELSQAYQEISARKSIDYAQLALQLSHESGVREDIAESLANLGSAYYHLSNFKKAVEFQDQRNSNERY